jgi:glycosyltransferase involved in cell wall biosynthesis
MVTPRYLPLMGGIETHVAEVARRLAADVDVTVLTTDTSGELPERESTDGFEVRRFAAYPRSRDYYFSPGLLRAVRATDADLVHVQGVHTLVAPGALLVTRRAGIPTAITFHTGGSSMAHRRAARGVQWKLLAPLLRGADRRIAVCEYEIERFGASLDLPPSAFDLVRNGSERLPIDEKAPDDVRGDPLVASVGRLEQYKGHHRVVAALPELLRRAPRAHLCLVGAGPYEAELRALAERLGVAAALSIRAFGPAERGAMGALIARSDVVALLSDYEAHPVAVMEALGLGRPVVLADTSGMSELGRPGPGGEPGLATLVAPTASGEHVAAVLLEAASSRRWEAGPPELPSWDDCAEALLRIYREMPHRRR